MLEPKRVLSLEWAEPDLNRRPLACKANVLTRLDDRPSILKLELAAVIFRSIVSALSN